MWYFYVLKSSKKNWFYRGSTGDLKNRIKEHNNGEITSSRPYIPLSLVYYEAYISEMAAREREKSVKNSGSVWTPLKRRIENSLSCRSRATR